MEPPSPQNNVVGNTPINEEDDAETDVKAQTEPRRSPRSRAARDEPDSASSTAQRRPKLKVKRIVKKSKAHISNKQSPTRERAEDGNEEMKDDPNPVTPDDDGDDDPPVSKKRKVSKRVSKTVKQGETEESASDDDKEGVKTTPSKRARRKTKETTKEDNSKTEQSNATPKKSKKTKAPPHQVLTEKCELPKLWDPSKAPQGSSTLKIASWNVAGLRALLKKMPNVLSDLAQQHNLDILCLQETKLQEQHVDDPKLNIPTLEDVGYQAFYSCSTAKKGYSGTAVFVHNRLGKIAVEKNKQEEGDKKQPKKKKTTQQATMDKFLGGTSSTKTTKTKTESASSGTEKSADSSESVSGGNLPMLQKVSFQMGKEKHDGEGRLVMLDFSSFSFCNVYVPNSGQQLQRLDYRTKDWDKDFLAFMKEKQTQRGCPVLWVGDLNVAHTNLEVWNDGAKHLPKQAGVTPQERESFQAQLDAGFVDAFRRLHPQTSGGHYTYWSQRAGNRPVNKGLRLDYFVCDPKLFEESSNIVARDSYMLEDQLGSDHCPVILELEVKGSV